PHAGAHSKIAVLLVPAQQGQRHGAVAGQLLRLGWGLPVSLDNSADKSDSILRSPFDRVSAHEAEAPITLPADRVLEPAGQTDLDGRAAGALHGEVKDGGRQR